MLAPFSKIPPSLTFCMFAHPITFFEIFPLRATFAVLHSCRLAHRGLFWALYQHARLDRAASFTNRRVAVLCLAL